MGAQTARMLAQLLEHGSSKELEQDYSGHQPVSPLFDPNQPTKNRIHSILSVAGSHNGSTLSNGLKEMVPVIEEFVVGLIAFLGIDSSATVAQVYDVKLDHFGLTPRGVNESLHTYFGRVAEASDDFLNNGRKDICLWDLSPEGAAEQNAWVHAQDNIYYLSYSSRTTGASPVPALLDNLEHHQLPKIHTLPPFATTATMLGRYTCADARYHGITRARDGQFYGLSLEQRVVIDSTWWENDGVVNTISQDGPWLYPADYTGPEDIIMAWDNLSIPPKGVWNHGAIFDGVDHLDATGLELVIADIHGGSDFDHIEDWYLERADFLKSLP
jgi:triacylglycerol lipase